MKGKFLSHYSATFTEHIKTNKANARNLTIQVLYILLVAASHQNHTEELIWVIF